MATGFRGFATKLASAWGASPFRAALGEAAYSPAGLDPNVELPAPFSREQLDLLPPDVGEAVAVGALGLLTADIRIGLSAERMAETFMLLGADAQDAMNRAAVIIARSSYPGSATSLPPSVMGDGGPGPAFPSPSLPPWPSPGGGSSGGGFPTTPPIIPSEDDDFEPHIPGWPPIDWDNLPSGGPIGSKLPRHMLEELQNEGLGDELRDVDEDPPSLPEALDALGRAIFQRRDEGLAPIHPLEERARDESLTDIVRRSILEEIWGLLLGDPVAWFRLLMIFLRVRRLMRGRAASPSGSSQGGSVGRMTIAQMPPVLETGALVKGTAPRGVVNNLGGGLSMFPVGPTPIAGQMPGFDFGGGAFGGGGAGGSWEEPNRPRQVMGVRVPNPAGSPASPAGATAGAIVDYYLGLGGDSPVAPVAVRTTTMPTGMGLYRLYLFGRECEELGRRGYLYRTDRRWAAISEMGYVPDDGSVDELSPHLKGVSAMLAAAADLEETYPGLTSCLTDSKFVRLAVDPELGNKEIGSLWGDLLNIGRRVIGATPIGSIVNTAIDAGGAIVRALRDRGAAAVIPQGDPGDIISGRAAQQQAAMQQYVNMGGMNPVSGDIALHCRPALVQVINGLLADGAIDPSRVGGTGGVPVPDLFVDIGYADDNKTGAVEHVREMLGRDVEKEIAAAAVGPDVMDILARAYVLGSGTHAPDEDAAVEAVKLLT